MKAVTLTCSKCKTKKMFRGTNIDIILAKILTAGLCPVCYCDKWERELGQEDEGK